MTRMSTQEPSPKQAPTSNAAKGIQRTVLRPSKEHILVGIVLFLICLMFTAYKAEWFFWVPLLPLIFIVWVLRARTTVSAKGIEAVYLFRPKKTLPWQDFRGIRFNRGGKAFAASHNDTQFWLPGVSFNSLVTLNEATQGIIPDPVTPAQEEVNRKVQVVHKDGGAVLMEADDYAEYEKQRRAEHEKSDHKDD